MYPVLRADTFECVSQSFRVIQTLTAVLGALIGLAGLLVSYLAHRHKVRHDAALAAEEMRLLEREREAEQQEARVQASMLRVHVALSRSALHDGLVTPKVVVANQSNQPIQDVCVSLRDEAVGETSLFPTGEMVFPLPLSEAATPTGRLMREVTIDFTDAAGIRWRRQSGGSLRRGRINEALGAWEWGEPEAPVVGWATGLPIGAVAGAARAEAEAETEAEAEAGMGPWGRHMPPVLVTLVLSVMVLIATALWWGIPRLLGK